MKLNFVVLTDGAPAGAPLLAYAAALAEPLGATLHLVHVLSHPLLVPLEFGELGASLLATGYESAVHTELTRAAACLSVPATVDVREDDWQSALDQVLTTYQPALLVAGLTATDGPLDEWLSNRALPLAYQTGYPLLLVPEFLPSTHLHPPRCLVLAVEDHAFRLTPQGQALATLLALLRCTVTPVTVRAPDYTRLGGADWPAVQHCGLPNNLFYKELHEVVDERPASGIWQAADELEADMVALLDQGHGWVHKLFSGSVIADVLRYSQVPVLLLPVVAS